MSKFRNKDVTKMRELMTLRFDDDGRPESFSTLFLKLLKEIEISGEVEIEGLKVQIKGKSDPSSLIQYKQRQLSLFSTIHEVAARVADMTARRYYILIDDLDVEWHNEPAQREIIAALFDSLMRICRPPNIKCVVAIQERIFSELPIDHKDKFRDWICEVDWDADSIREMIEKRIVHVVEIPKQKIWNGLFPLNGFSFIWNNIGGKPREAIRLASLCIETAMKNGHVSIDPQDMILALKKFSSDRLEDISSELEYIYPSFLTFLRTFNGYQKEFPGAKNARGGSGLHSQKLGIQQFQAWMAIVLRERSFCNHKSHAREQHSDVQKVSNRSTATI